MATLRSDVGADVKPVHRLDRETSGIVLFAKTRFAAAKLEVQFRERVVKKAYMAILRGHPPEAFTVDRPIARRIPAEPPYFRTVDDASGKPAVTAFRTLWSNTERSLVAVHPSQGRTNQIRVHAAHAGFPVLGDRIYGVDPALARAFVAGGPSPDIDAAAGAPRHMLHALALAFRHPVDGREVTVRAAPPEDFSARADFTDYDSVTFS